MSKKELTREEIEEAIKKRSPVKTYRATVGATPAPQPRKEKVNGTGRPKPV